jgi:hypothetical protein
MLFCPSCLVFSFSCVISIRCCNQRCYEFFLTRKIASSRRVLATAVDDWSEKLIALAPVRCTSFRLCTIIWFLPEVGSSNVCLVQWHEPPTMMRTSLSCSAWRPPLSSLWYARHPEQARVRASFGFCRRNGTSCHSSGRGGLSDGDNVWPDCRPCHRHSEGRLHWRYFV